MPDAPHTSDASVRPTTVPTVFLHMPRTGGTTLNTIFKRVYAAGPLFQAGLNGSTHIDACARFVALPPEQRAAFAYVTGHLERAVLTSIPGRPFIFTFLRDPVTRLPSLYAYVKRTPDHHMHPWLVHTNASLEHFVARCPWDEVQNGMTRRLAGVFQARTNERIDLLRAVATIKRYVAFVGLQEDFDTSLRCLGRLLGLPESDLHYVRQNVNPDPAALEAPDTNAIDAIRFYNALDCALYDFCRELFTEEVCRVTDVEASEAATKKR